MAKKPSSRSSLFDPVLLREAVIGAFVKLNPVTLAANPVMLTVGVSSILATLLTLRDAVIGKPFGLGLQISVWLWFTVLFGNFAEAVAEGRGKAQADSLRKTKTDTLAKKIPNVAAMIFKTVPAADLRLGDLVVAEAGDVIPGDGDVVKGIATVDESSITGESAPVIRESGGYRRHARYFGSHRD